MIKNDLGQMTKTTTMPIIYLVKNNYMEGSGSATIK